MLKNSWRRAKALLVMGDGGEADGMKRRIADNEVYGLDRCVVATRPEFSKLCEWLKEQELTDPVEEMPMKGRRFPELQDGLFEP